MPTFISLLHLTFSVVMVPKFLLSVAFGRL